MVTNRSIPSHCQKLTIGGGPKEPERDRVFIVFVLLVVVSRAWDCVTSGVGTGMWSPPLVISCIQQTFSQVRKVQHHTVAS